MNTMVTTLKRMTLLALLPLLISCGDSGTASSPATSGASKLSARFIGTMPSDLADELNQEFSTASVDSTAPLLISGVDVTTLSDTERSAIKATFDNDIPVILVRPTRAQREALRSLVGLAGTDLSDDIPDFWGLQTSRTFEIWEYGVAAPAARQITDTDITTYQDNGTSQTSDGPPITEYLFDMPVYQLSRVAGLREWLTLAPQRSNSQEMAATVAKASVVKSDDAKAILEKIILADYVSRDFSYLRNKYSINLQSRTVYQAPYNHFVIQARGALSAYNEWMATTTESERTATVAANRGRIADSYYLRFSIPDTQADEVAITSNILPKTEESKEKISNTLGWSLGGKVTGGVECEVAGSKKDGIEGGCTGKVGGELSFGVTSSESRTFTVADVKIENKSGPIQPAWLFSILKPEIEQGFLNWYIAGIKKPVSNATSTFQPEMTWVWQVSDSFKQRYPNGLPITITFKPVLRHMYLRGLGELKDITLEPELYFTEQVTLPWPPTTATVKKQ